MTIEAEIIQKIRLTEQEYEFIVLFRSFEESNRTGLVQFAERLKSKPRDIPGQQFLDEIDALRTSLDDTEFTSFKQSLAAFDQIDSEAWD